MSRLGGDPSTIFGRCVHDGARLFAISYANGRSHLLSTPIPVSFRHVIGMITMQTGPSDTFVAHKAISLAEDLTGTEKRVAATIIDHFNRKTGRCDPALGSIARLLGLGRRTIIRAVG